MKSRKTLGVLSVLSLLVILGAGVFAWSAARIRSTHADSGDQQLFSEHFNGQTYDWSRPAGSAISTTGDDSVDGGTLTMSQNGTAIGNVDDKVTVGDLGNGKYTYTVSITSTIPDFPSVTQVIHDYPLEQIQTDYSYIDQSAYGDTALKYSEQDYELGAPDLTHTEDNYNHFVFGRASFGDGSTIVTNTAQLIDQENTNYQALQTFVDDSGSPQTQVSSQAVPMAFKAQRLTVAHLRYLTIAGLTLALVGSTLAAWCGQGFCGGIDSTQTRVLAAIGVQICWMATATLVVSGWSMMGALIQSTQQALPRYTQEVRLGASSRTILVSMIQGAIGSARQLSQRYLAPQQGPQEPAPVIHEELK